VAGFGAENRSDLFRIHGEGQDFSPASVQRGWNFPGNAQPPRFVFASRGAWSAFYNDVSHSFFSFLESLPAELRAGESQINSSLIEVSS
jgi:hypothetical protein